ncbi:MAG TPA: hypothetical protein VGY53_06710, partial [Isosphaeraceae bacterium]|nr:hypothetical protein [Isosphaeraceae bacterium]
LVPVQALWVNTQGLFVFGPILMGMALVAAALQPGAFRAERLPWWRTPALATFLVGLACLANPYFLKGALFPLELARTMRNPIFSESIAELRPVGKFLEETGVRNFQVQMHLVTLLLGALSFLIPLCWSVAARHRGAAAPTNSAPASGKKASGKAKPAKRRGRKRSQSADAPGEESAWRVSPFRFMLFVALSALSFQATRNSHQYAAVVGALTAWNFGEWAATIARRRAAAGTAPPAPRIAPRLVALAAMGVAIFALGSGWLYTHAAEGRTIGLGEEPLWFPHAAARFAGEAGLPPKFLGFHLGHNALFEYYHGPERKVFADPRLEVMGPEVFQHYRALQSRLAANDPGWERELETLGRPVVLADLAEASSASVAATLLGHSRWRCLWFDPIAAVFAYESFASGKPAVDFGARHFHPRDETDPHGVPALLASAKAIRNVASTLQRRGRLDLVRPLVALGLDHARKARDADPASLDAWKLLGQLEDLREPLPDKDPIPRFRMAFDPVFDLALVRSSYEMRQALERAPSDFLCLIFLAGLDSRRGMDETALPLHERLLTTAPTNFLQTQAQEEVKAHIDALRARVGPAPEVPVPANRNEHDRLLAALLAAGRPASAARLIERDYPPQARSWEQADRLATLHLHMGQPARARAAWEAATAPRLALRLARIAVTHLVEGHFDAARRAYNEALAAEPGLFEALYGLAVLEQDAGRAPAALAAAREAQAHAVGDVAQSAANTIAAWVAPYAAADRSPSRDGSAKQ